jgi:hypothetical protein
MRSVPPRGSGWVLFAFQYLAHVPEPTRYRVVVPTSSPDNENLSRQSVNQNCGAFDLSGQRVEVGIFAARMGAAAGCT